MAEWQFWLLMFGVWFNILFMILSYNAVNPFKRAGLFWVATPVIFLVYTVIMFIDTIFG